MNNRQKDTLTYGTLHPEKLAEILESIDRKVRPYIIQCHPAIKSKLEKALGDKFKIIESPFVPEDKIYVIKRETLENIDVKMVFR